MKPISNHPHDPLDELLAAALHGELTAAERAELDARLATDPAARAAYQEIQHMHDLLEKNYRDAQPDPAFEERMISAVRRKVREEETHRETMWESVGVLWRAVKRPLVARPAWALGAMCLLIVAGLVLVPRIDPQSGLFAIHGISRNVTVHDGDTQVAGHLVAENSVDQKRAQQTDAAKASFFAGVTESTPTAPITAPSVVTLNGMKSESDQPKGMASAQQALPAAPAQVAQAQQAATDALVAAPPASPAMFNLAGAFPEHAAVAQMQEDSQRRDKAIDADSSRLPAAPSATSPAPAEPSRKLIRNAQLDLEVKSYQKAVDDITALTKAGGGYLDSSNSQRGGNGKLQGTIVVKVLPENLDTFLLKLRGLGEIKNQAVSTEDVTKDYYDTQARLDNSHRMETQLQELLKHDNGRVSDLLQVERELGRVRGDIEQMQGQLKLYDFQVQYATVTIALAEKDLDQAAAYLLREHDQFSLFARNVEDAFAQAKTAADGFKAKILSANLQHDAGSNMTAQLAFSVPPDQIDGFLARVKSLGRVDNFTRQTQRVANDGGDASAPADQTRTEKSPVQVDLTIRSDDESPRQQTQLAIISTGDIDTQAQQVKNDAIQAGESVTASNFERAPDGTETATMTFRLALSKVGDLMPELEKLGRVESLTVQRNDRPDQPAADPNAPAEITLRLHNQPDLENETPRQQTQLAIVTTGDVDAQARQIKSDALKSGMAVTTSSFERRPDGMETAQITFRLPMSQAAAFTATLEKLGRVESLAVQRNDAPGDVTNDPNAPAEISLQLHNAPALVADDSGLWFTLRRTFGHGVAAFLGSVQAIGVIVAFVLPWLAALVVLAWIGRRIYVARKR